MDQIPQNAPGTYNSLMRPRHIWELRSRKLTLGERTLVMGVVNVTPDSFSDGGQFDSSASAVDQALRLLSEGADILDIGGESTRPGVSVGQEADVSSRQELERIMPVIEGVLRARPDAVISVDTYKAATAAEAIRAGAEIVNDVSGLAWDPAMGSTLAELGCGAVLMHTRGTPSEWRNLPALKDPFEMVLEDLGYIAKKAQRAGVEKSRVVLDVGFGFGKRFDENYPLIARFGEFAKLGFPLLAGPSRKSFVGRTIGRRRAEASGSEVADAPANERLYGTLAAVVACVLQGAHIVRVHDVAAVVDAIAVADAILAAE
jgi:dihydropteroate synthase